MSNQIIFGRDYKLILKPDNDDHITCIPPMQVKFTVINSANNAIATALITVYGFSAATRNRLRKKDVQQEDFTGFGDVELHAGYEGAITNIFDGKINYVEVGREGPNLYTRFYCSTKLTEWRNTAVNKTWSGNTPAIEVLTDVASVFGLRVELNGDFSDIQPFVKGYSSSRKASEELDEMALHWGFTWRITSSSIIITRKNAVRNQDAIEISAKNGMEGTPRFYFEKTEIDIKLDGTIQPDDLIKVNSDYWSINYNAMYYSDFKNVPQMLVSSGRFKVLSTSHEGDFWGDTWKTTLGCYWHSGGANG
ncbi:hypothetical protein NXA99_07220 [Citrobacter amalonaticus]|jgi:hypothetical protein|uniref:phage protein n=1 Tax=Citrobacter amalonaticus TaxID=35703 RepID=UPI00215CA2A0|nr:hypothetical protein [Citrobacter amalonaticus]MCR9028323.1 hypothetical protein [Citrobacter amalonaticus]